MKQITINLPTVEDFTKWFWDKFCFPRRKLVKEWLLSHNDELARATETILIKYQGVDLSKDSFKGLQDALNDWNKECDAITKETEKLIMQK